MSESIEELRDQVSQSMLGQQFQFRRQLKRLSSGNPDDAALHRLADQIRESVDRRQQRAQSLPKIELDHDLPIFHRQQEIVEAVRNHQVVVISGETGSGKSTQLPLMMLEAGFGVAGMIGHTQPRRIAARGVASRIAQQINSPLGQSVGFKIRFADQTGDDTFVKLMTDGILLAETQSDRFLNQYDLIIVDEAHERSLNIDFLLGYLKNTLAKRSDLRLVITSATIDTERFAEHFSTDDQSVPIIDVQGRTYPVDIRYQPPEMLADGTPREPEDHLVSVCQELAAIDDGDMLVFLPTEADIRSTTKKLRNARLPGRQTEILPLYARLSTDQQNAIFQPGKQRRIVLATNVAESSITVPRIRFVVDTGTARISHYSPRSKVQRLPIQAVSQASADQRAGRCGRIGPGICVRLYSEEDYQSRAKFTTPEIRRTNLASVILQTLALRLGQIDQFPFIDPPRPEAIRDGFKTLFEIGAVDHRRQLTALGKTLARMPVDPRIGRMICAADDENCLSEILIIAAALEIQDPRVRPAEKQQAADTQHEKFRDEKSDFMSLLKIWDFFHQLKSDLSRGRLKKACEQNFLSYPLMRQWQDIHRQLLSMIRNQNLKTRPRQDNYDAIHRSLMTGLLSGIAQLTEKHEYTGAANVKFHLWPGSGVFASKPKWIIAAEVVETTRRYGRTVAKINPDWIEPLAEHLTKHQFHDPHWSKKQQAVMASENVTLFGMPIVLGRRVGYASVDPEVARDLFIEHGLVDDQYAGKHPFLEHNRWLLAQVKVEADKTRNRELIVDRYQILLFYQTHLPAGIYDASTLKHALRSDPELDGRLRMTRADVLPTADVHDLAGQFPDEVKIGSMRIPVAYRFQPGTEDDGASIQIPVEGVGQLDDVQTGWLVPGLLETRVVALIRSLPKQVRRNLVPAPDTAAEVARQIEYGRGRFVDAVAQCLTRIGGLPIDETMFKLDKVDRHLHVNLQVVDEQGQVVAQGRSVGELRSQLGAEHASNLVEVEDETWRQDGLTDWQWDELPREIAIQRGSTQLGAFPSIVDQGDSVGLRLADSPNASDMTTRQGLVRLFQLQNRKLLKSQVNWLPDLDSHALRLGRLLESSSLKRQLQDLICRIAFVDREKIPRDRAAFDALQQRAAERVGVATQDVAKWLPKFSAAVHSLELQLEECPDRFTATKRAIERQIQQLASDGFLAQTPWCWLQHYPRYFEAMAYRIEKRSTTAAEKDQESQDLVDHYWQQYSEISGYHRTHAIVDPELQQFRWMIEELCVSLFAQPLGTAIKVSPQRLDKQWGKVRKT